MKAFHRVWHVPHLGWRAAICSVFDDKASAVPTSFCPNLSQLRYGTRNLLYSAELRLFLVYVPRFLKKVGRCKTFNVTAANSIVAAFQLDGKCAFCLGHAFCLSPHVSKGGTFNVEYFALTHVRACAFVPPVRRVSHVSRVSQVSQT